MSPGREGADEEGSLVGAEEGTPVGLLEVGLTVGCAEGKALGALDGCTDG